MKKHAIRRLTLSLWLLAPFVSAADSGTVDIAFVIDDTQSMATELASMATTLTKFIADSKKTLPQGTNPVMELITFKDVVTSRIVTNDMDLLIKQVNLLKAEGGDKCPEASIEALNLAISHLKKGGQILLATDASPHPNANLAQTKVLLSNKKIKLNAIVSGECSSTRIYQE